MPRRRWRNAQRLGSGAADATRRGRGARNSISTWCRDGGGAIRRRRRACSSASSTGAEALRSAAERDPPLAFGSVRGLRRTPAAISRGHAKALYGAAAVRLSSSAFAGKQNQCPVAPSGQWALSRFVFVARTSRGSRPAGCKPRARWWISGFRTPISMWCRVPIWHLAVDAEGRVDHPQAAAFPAGWVTLHVDAEAALGDLCGPNSTSTPVAVSPPIRPGDRHRRRARLPGALFWLPRGIRHALRPARRYWHFHLAAADLDRAQACAAARRLFGRYGLSPPAAQSLMRRCLIRLASSFDRLEHRLTPLPVARDDSRPATVNVLLPTLDASIVFGGYIAIFNFIVKLRDWGYRTRIVLCDSDHVDLPAVTAKLAGFPGIVAAIENAEWAFSGTRGGDLPASGKDVFVSFSVWTALLAQGATEAIGRRVTCFSSKRMSVFFTRTTAFAPWPSKPIASLISHCSTALCCGTIFAPRGWASTTTARRPATRPRPVMPMP